MNVPDHYFLSSFFMSLVTLCFHFLSPYFYCYIFYIVPLGEWIKYTSCWLMLKVVSESEELRQVKTPFPLCPLVAARVEHCIAWVRVKPSFCIHHPCHLDRFTVCLLLSKIKLTLTPLLLTGICFDQPVLEPTHAHTHTIMFICTVSLHTVFQPWGPGQSRGSMNSS